jgi:pimeloyl-ACP methyl ester carboxylesterase
MDVVGEIWFYIGGNSITRRIFIMHNVLTKIWSDWRMSFGAALALTILVALLSAWLTPRGPVTTAQALWTMGLTLVLGLAAGLVTGSRWSLLATPVVFVIVFELTRIGAAGPTVDSIQLNSTYGIIAFVTGRLFHGLLALAPLMVSARFGVALAARLGNPQAAALGFGGWVLNGLIALGLFVLSVALARPATTQPVIGSDGDPLPGSIAELVEIPLGGLDQTILIRGRSLDSPVLLYLAGGPGGTDLGAMRGDVTLEQDFIVVTWDQRGTGKSYPALEPVETLTLEQMISDTIELTHYLRERFGQDKIYLVGNSWGTLLGALVVERQPELFHAYVGAGQMVSLPETDRMFWEDSLDWAERTGNEGLAATLRQNGPPPYANLLDYEPALSHEHDWNPYAGLDTSKEMPFNTFVPENSLIDRVNALRGLLDTFVTLYPQLQDVDLRKDAASLEIPVYIVTGKYEARGRATPAQAWYEILEAPHKEWITFENSGHRTLFEEPAAFAEMMKSVFAVTYLNE